MSFIRTTDENENPIEQEQMDPITEALTEPAKEIIGIASSEAAGMNRQQDPEPMTREQMLALNEALENMDKAGYNSVDSIIELRDEMKRLKINDGIRNRVLTDFVKGEYLDPNREFTEKQAISALHTLLGTPKEEAAATVKSWWQHPADAMAPTEEYQNI